MQYRRLILALASSAALSIIGCSNPTVAPAGSPAAATAELQSLTVDQVEARIAAHDGKTYVYDNNPKDSWVKAHLPGATWLDEETITAADLPADKTAQLIFYCHNES